MLQYHGFILFPGILNTTAVSQEKDQNYGPFQSQFRVNLQVVVDKRITQNKVVNLAPWVVGLIVFGGTDVEVDEGPTIESAFQRGFLKEQCIAVWEKVGAVPLSRKCLQDTKVRRLIGDGDECQQSEVLQTQSVNDIATHALSMSGYDGNVLKGTIIPIKATEVITVPHTQEQIDLLAQAKKHGQIFTATGGDHLTSNNMFKSIELKARMVAKAELIRAKKISERLEKNELNGRLILEAKSSNPLKLTVADLTIVLTWHQHQKISGMKKAAKVLAWKGIVDNNRQPPLFSKWTKADERKQAAVSVTTVTIRHTALGRMVDMKKKELVLAAATMSNDEFEVLRQDQERRLYEQRTDQESLAPTKDKLAAALVTSVNATTERTEGSL